MKKLQLTKSLALYLFDENDYLKNQKDIYDDLAKILNSFDSDENIKSQREYVDNLNGDIFLENKKVLIFLLKQNCEPVSFAVMSKDSLDALATNFEYAKLGFATILLRAMAAELKEQNITNFCVEIDQNNFVAMTLFESFGKVDGVEIFEKTQKNGKKMFKFDIKNTKIDKILQEIKDFAI